MSFPFFLSEEVYLTSSPSSRYKQNSFHYLMGQRLWDFGEGFAAVARLIHAADEDALECGSNYIYHSTDTFANDAADLSGSREELGPTQYQSWLDRGKLLKQLGFQPDEGLIGSFVGSVMNRCQKFPKESLAAMLSVLVKLGGDVNLEDEFGRPLLYWMMCHSTKENNHSFTALAIALLQNGADPCALDMIGRSPLDWAKYKSQNVKWYEILEEAGFDVREVELEIEKRKWCYDNPGDGFTEKNTAVDEDDVTGPSTEGLSHRRAIVGDRLDE